MDRNFQQRGDFVIFYTNDPVVGYFIKKPNNVCKLIMDCLRVSQARVSNLITLALSKSFK